MKAIGPKMRIGRAVLDDAVGTVVGRIRSVIVGLIIGVVVGVASQAGGPKAMAATMEAEVLDLTTAARAAQVIAPEVQLARLQVLEAEFSLVEAEIGNGPTQNAELLEAEHALAEAKVALLGALADVAFKTHEAFYHVLRTRELLELQEHRANQAQSQHVIAAARYEAGMLAHLDLLGVELDKDRAEAERRDAERRHEAARRTLSEMTGLDPLPPLHWAEVDFTFSPIGITLHEALAQALRTHPDVGSAHFALKAAERRLEHARISQLPPVQVSRVELEVERAQIRLAQVKREVDREVRLIWDELRSAETTVALREKDLALANQRLEVAEARYDTGGISLIELFAARTEALQARLDVSQAHWDYNLKKARFLRLIGEAPPVPIPAEFEQFLPESSGS